MIDINDVRVFSFTPCGEVYAPPSKSFAHRAIICAALARGVSKLSCIELSDDIKTTIAAIEKLGIKTAYSGNCLIVDSTDGFTCDSVSIDCNESGSTVRFFIPLLAALGINGVLDGKGNLPYRPLDEYIDCFSNSSVCCKFLSDKNLPLSVSGRLSPGKFYIRGNISSQFITGLLLSLPLLDGDSEIMLTTKCESVSYIDITIGVLNDFGVEIKKTESGYFIKGSQTYKARDYTVEGDWSNAAFFLVAAAICGEVVISGLNANSIQGDREIFNILEQYGADIEFRNNKVFCRNAVLNNINIDATNIPDLVPILSVLAAASNGSCNIYGASRLRIKESDRLLAMKTDLELVGCDINVTEDGLYIVGGKKICSNNVFGFNDHRIVMSLSIAACCLNNGEYIQISEAGSINKSYPDFFEHLKILGGTVCVVNN